MECPQSAFLGCILQLKLSGVTFDRNIANIIYSIDSETKLLKTCKAYTNILPCFREKISQCGSQKQRRMLNSVGKSIDFLCSPFSLGNQRILLSKGSCINYVINKPISNNCEIDEPRLYASLSSCAKNCERQKGNVFCHMRTWISTQNLCTTLEIYKNCGSDAASFYSDFQSVAFEPTFPIVCEASIESIAYVKNFFKFNGKQLYEKKINNVIPFMKKNTNFISNIVKETLPLTNYNDQNTNNVFLKSLNEKLFKNNDNLKEAEKILEKIFPDMITKNYGNLVTTTLPSYVTEKQNTYPFIDVITPKTYLKLNHKKGKENILSSSTYSDEDKMNDIRRGTVMINEIELLAKIMSNLPVNNTPINYQSPHSNDILPTQSSTTTIKYNNVNKNLLSLLNNQNDNDQPSLLTKEGDKNMDSGEVVTSTEENLEDYESSIEYQTSTTTIYTTTTPKIKLNIPKIDATKKSTIKQTVEGKKIPWYLRSMKKHVFVNTHDGFKKFSQ